MFRALVSPSKSGDPNHCLVAGYVNAPERWVYSSAKGYEKINGPIELAELELSLDFLRTLTCGRHRRTPAPIGE